MVLWSYLLGCAGPALTAACAMTYKDPFVLPMNPAQRKDAKSAKIALSQVSCFRFLWSSAVRVIFGRCRRLGVQR